MNENMILRDLSSPFIINMKSAFQDRENLYLVMPSLKGGDLRYHIIKNRTFNEKTVKFFVACIILSLKHVHSKNIIHRDIKPENLVLDETGYLHLTDFGIAKHWRPENHQDTSGTPSYMAPEVLCRRNHSYSVDFYALGVIMYECIVGKRPYLGKSRKEIKEQVLAKQAAIKPSDVYSNWSFEAIIFCNKLIQRKRSRRLGENSVTELMNHPWFNEFDWRALERKRMRAPFVPTSGDNYDKKNVNKIDDFFEVKDLELLKKNSIQYLFNGYEYDEKIFGVEREKVKKEDGTYISYEKSTGI